MNNNANNSKSLYYDQIYTIDSTLINADDTTKIAGEIDSIEKITRGGCKK